MHFSEVYKNSFGEINSCELNPLTAVVPIWGLCSLNRLVATPVICLGNKDVLTSYQGCISVADAKSSTFDVNVYRIYSSISRVFLAHFFVLKKPPRLILESGEGGFRDLLLFCSDLWGNCSLSLCVFLC